MSKKKDVIVLFSGGKDSFLASCQLLELGYRIHMVTFENGCGLKADNAKHGANRIIKLYGSDKASYMGVINVSGIWREFFLPYFNLKPSEIIDKYGELPVSQFHCVTCRSSMYIWSIIKAKQENIKYIADGAREDQAFVIELPIMIEAFKQFFAEYDISLLLPVYDLDSNWELKNSLLTRGFVPKTLEPQCLLGVPLPGETAPDKDTQNAVHTFFTSVIKDRANKLINRYLTENIKTSVKSEF